MFNSKKRSALLDRYQKLISVSRELASELDLNILLAKIVTAASEVSNAEEASILLYDPGKRTLYFQAATNLDSHLRRGLAVPLEGSIAGWIVGQQKPLIVDDPQKDKRHFDYIGKITNIQCHSLLGIPLLSKGTVIGVLEVINKQSGKFNLEDQDVLMALGAQASVAIENSRLFLQSDLIGEFVHEIRTPLSALSAAAHLLKNNRVSDEQKKKMIGIMESEIKSLSDMSSSFLDLARLESGRKQYQVEEFDLCDLIRECQEIISTDAAQNDLRLDFIIPKPLPLILGDPKQLKQALINLLNNAIKYNRPGGSIRLSAEEKDQRIILTLTDTGLGIPEEDQPRIFEKFYRVKSHRDLVPGTGLGLSVVKQIISGHGGEISLTSRIGQGTTFFVSLPVKV